MTTPPTRPAGDGDRQIVGPARSSAADRRISRTRGVRRQTWVGWLFVAPGAGRCTRVFVLQPLALTVQYSLYRWDGVGPATWVGLSNYVTVLSEPRLLETLFNAFRLVLFFSLIPVALGLVTASVIQRVATGPAGHDLAHRPVPAAGHPARRRRDHLGPAAVAARARQPGASRPIGLGDVTRAWLGDFDTALPAVGIIGIWVLLGFCTVLLLTGMTKIDAALYESARLDGAGWFQEFRAITVPSLRHEIGVCLTVTVDRRARRVRHRLRLDRRWARRRDRRARASRSTSSPSSSARSASPRRSPSSSSSSCCS